MSNFVGIAEFWTGRPVVDKTGIQGEFDLPLTSGWVQEDQAAPVANLEGDPGSAPEALPSFYGLYQKFGLTLKPRRASVDILVIGHLERPSEN